MPPTITAAPITGKACATASRRGSVSSSAGPGANTVGPSMGGTPTSVGSPTSTAAVSSPVASVMVIGSEPVPGADVLVQRGGEVLAGVDADNLAAQRGGGAERVA